MPITRDAYTAADAHDLAALVRDGAATPAELVDEAIAAIGDVDPQLNAVVHDMADHARQVAKDPPAGPFRGVPMVVKDFDGFVQGQPWTASTRFLEGFVAPHDSEAIARLRRAGLVFCAKTNLPELAIIGTTENEWRGATKNPWGVAHTAGGSSGGTAALVAARAVPVGHGGDGGGSLRIPASACGLVGLKATRGRIPLGPDHGEGWGGYVQWGTLTRTVRDAAAMLDLMGGPMAGDPYAAPTPARPFVDEVGADPGTLRIGLVTDPLFGRVTDPVCKEAAERAGKALEALGHQVEVATLPVSTDALAHAYLVQVGVGVAAEIEEFSRLSGRRPAASWFEASTWFLRQVGLSMSGLDLQHARDAAQEAGRQMGAWHQRYDLFLGPTLGLPPVELGSLLLKPADRLGLGILRTVPLRPAIRAVLAQLAANNFDATGNTQLFNQTGAPAISLPLHWTDQGLPVGVQLAAALGREDLLLQVSAQLEQALPWRDRRPAVCA
ncbi:MAG: amidase [Alphaproteobacteria bacterium]|nr:amidase [Alphaproteobacteria bacterium]